VSQVGPEQAVTVGPNQNVRATLPAGLGGLAAMVAAGGANLVIGIFLGIAIAKAGRST
jgi:hypothetical protein